MKTIKILGSGCANCKKLEAVAREAATSAATGMGIISGTLFALLAPGKRVVSVKDTYGGTNVIFTEFLPKFQIEVKLCDTTDHNEIEAEIAKGCDLLYLESPTNPTTKVVDLACLSKAGKAAGAIVVVDNTFATPINQNPVDLGADLVLHSATNVTLPGPCQSEAAKRSQAITSDSCVKSIFPTKVVPPRANASWHAPRRAMSTSGTFGRCCSGWRCRAIAQRPWRISRCCGPSVSLLRRSDSRARPVRRRPP